MTSCCKADGRLLLQSAREPDVGDTSLYRPTWALWTNGSKYGVTGWEHFGGAHTITLPRENPTGKDATFDHMRTIFSACLMIPTRCVR